MFEAFGFVIAFLFGVYFIVTGVIGALAGYGFSGQAKNAITGLVFLGFGATIVALCVIYSPFSITVTA